MAAERDEVVFTTTVAVTTEAFVAPVAGELAKRGHPIHLICGDRPPIVDFKHAVSVLPMERRMSPRADAHSLWQWAELLRNARPRMVVAGTPKASLLALTAAKLTGVPTRVYVIHGAVWDGATGTGRRVLESAERATIAASTAQVAVSDSLARLVHTRGLSRWSPRVVGAGSFCGVDTHRFQPASRQGDRRPTLVFVGRLNRDKGIDVLLRTLNRVREDVDAQLVVVGGLDQSAPPDDATMRELASHPHVDWIGETSDVVKYYQSADLLLFPSRREGLGQVPLEAQSCGVPVVAWRVTGVVDAVRDGLTGILVPLGNEVGLANAVLDLLQDARRRTQMSHNSRPWVLDAFERDYVVDRMANHLMAIERN